MAAPLVYRPAAAADALQIATSTLRQKIRKGEVRSTKIGRAVLIPADEVERLAGMRVRRGDR